MTQTNFPFEIVVFPAGFVYVGEHDVENRVIHNCQNLHRWGTTKGLGQLIIGGPTSETLLHPAGRVEYFKSPDVRFPVKHDKMRYGGPETFCGKYLLIAERSFVYYGNVPDPVDGLFTVTEGSIVRKFGTTDSNLHLLATKGRTSETVLDGFGEAYLPVSSVLFRIPCVHPLD